MDYFLELLFRLAVLSIFVVGLIVLGKNLIKKITSWRKNTFIASATPEEIKIKSAWLISVWVFLIGQLLLWMIPIVVFKIYGIPLNNISEYGYTILMGLGIRCVYIWLIYTTAYKKRGTTAIFCYILLNSFGLLKEFFDTIASDFIITGVPAVDIPMIVLNTGTWGYLIFNMIMLYRSNRSVNKMASNSLVS
jgi:hypothetical protein